MKRFQIIALVLVPVNDTTWNDEVLVQWTGDETLTEDLIGISEYATEQGGAVITVAALPTGHKLTDSEPDLRLIH